MSIFGKPEEVSSDNEYGMKILFLHGLEGSPTGTKSRHLQEVWGAVTPHIRTSDMVNLKNKCYGQWQILDIDDIEEAMEISYNDARDAINYMKPDLVVGSSLGAALLFKLYASGGYTGPGVFLAPAVPHLIKDEDITSGCATIKDYNTTWLLGEVDTVVSNTGNVEIAKRCNGNIIFSPNDCHRLLKAQSSGILDAAILTSIETNSRS